MAMLKAPPLPTKKCAEPGCQRDAVSKGLCGPHYGRKKRRTAKGLPATAGEPVTEKQVSDAPADVAPSDDTNDDTPSEPITRTDVEASVVLIMGTLSHFVDESYSVLDEHHKLKPHAKKAIDDMMPWMEKYAPSFARWSPWIGLGMGVTALAAPAIEPTIEILSGVRKPRFKRLDEKDIYTDEYRAMLEKKPEPVTTKQVNN